VLEDGVTPAGNGGFGLSIQDANNSEIGENINDFCLIADNALGGIQLTGSGTFNTEVKGCLIGVTQLGNNFLGDQPSGIIIENQAHNNLIGLSNLDEGNVICHHSREGILITGAGTSNNTVVSNKIGIGISGSSSIANERGITLSDGASENIIGGANSQLRNYISG